MTINRRTALLSGLSLLALPVPRASAETASYTYDALGRLTSVTYSNGSAISYAYDAAGNRTLVTQTGTGAPVVTFTASPGVLIPGGSVVLSWTTTNATTVTIGKDIGSVALNGQVTVTQANTYTLTATGPGGTTTAEVQIAIAISNAFNTTIQIADSGPVNLRTLADAAGYNGAQDATITFVVGSAVTIMGAAGNSSNAGGRAIDTGVWPSGSYAIALTLQISGKVYGGGGSGGGSEMSVGNGGDSIFCQENLTIVVNAGGQIKGGGGGGGSGGGWLASYYDSEIDEWGESELSYGGAGGGGFPNGPSGTSYGPGGNGSAGTTSGGGAGGGIGNFGANRTTGAGGSGGGAAAAGATGTSSTGAEGCGAFVCRNKTSPAIGGTAGYAIRKNGKTVTVTNNGTIVGTQT